MLVLPRDAGRHGVRHTVGHAAGNFMDSVGGDMRSVVHAGDRLERRRSRPEPTLEGVSHNSPNTKQRNTD